ncbi:MAG: hypothetical protein V4511_08790 [Bacteroidota bacterium]
MKKTLLSGFLLILIFTTCKTIKQPEKAVVAKPALDCSSMEVTYIFDVKPVFETFCINCHGEEGDGGFNFIKITEIKRAAQSGTLLGSIKWHKGFSRMPEHGEQLDAKTINTIECWIKNGMKE